MEARTDAIVSKLAVTWPDPQFGRVSGYCENVWLVDLAECTKYYWLM